MPRGVRIGLRDVYYAVLTQDDVDDGVTYSAPERIIGAITANINPNSSTETLFADDGPMEVATTLGDIELELVMADLPLPVQAVLLGHDYADGKLTKKSSDSPPWVALGWKALKSNGSYRYTWLLKGRFMVPEESHETRGDSVDFQTPTINAAFTLRDFDDKYMLSGDEDEDSFTEAMGADWFTVNTLINNLADFDLAVSNATPDEDIAFDIQITNAVDAAGDDIAGATGITIVSDRGEDLSGFDSISLTAGAGDLTITGGLSTLGVHVLSVKLAGVPWWKTVEVDVQEVI